MKLMFFYVSMWFIQNIKRKVAAKLPQRWNVETSVAISDAQWTAGSSKKFITCSLKIYPPFGSIDTRDLTKRLCLYFPVDVYSLSHFATTRLLHKKYFQVKGKEQFY